jgi:hypothetical protein
MKKASLKLMATSVECGLPQRVGGGVAPYGLDKFAEMIGTKQNFIDMCRWSKSSTVKALVRHWDGLSREDQDNTPLGDLCERYSLDPQGLINEAVSSFSRMQSMIVRLQCAAALPQLMQASIEAALRPEGGRERELHFVMAGWLEANCLHRRR